MWSVRTAAPTDRGRLVELCHAAAGPDDYVPAFLDDFLSTGVVLLAEDSERVIGMVVYHDVPDGSAWLHAARTDPAYRRQGVATALMAQAERLSRRRHRSSMRLWASADNVASVRANTKYGFHERARFTRMRLEVPRLGSGIRLERLEPAGAWARFRGSLFLRLGGGYLFHDFYFLPWNRRTAPWLAREGALWGFGAHAVSVSEDFEDAGRRGLQIQLLAGDATAILRAAPAIARARGAARVESFLPHNPGLLETARREGFNFMDWGREAVLFEKRLPVRNAGSGTGRPKATAAARPRPVSP